MEAGSNFAFSSQGPEAQGRKKVTLEDCLGRKLPHPRETLEAPSQ